jgi:hypothetical protein
MRPNRSTGFLAVVMLAACGSQSGSLPSASREAGVASGSTSSGLQRLGQRSRKYHERRGAYRARTIMHLPVGLLGGPTPGECDLLLRE